MEQSARPPHASHASQLSDDILRTLGHELRTPLTSIKGNLQLAQRRLKTVIRTVEQGDELPINKLEDIQQMLTRAELQADAQNRMVAHILDVSHIQNNKFTLYIRACDLVQIVREAVEELQQGSVTERIRLELPSEACPVVVDSERIAEVVNNYLTNALKHSAPDQSIDVRLEIEEAMARVSVQDHGLGLAPEEQERVWERFYRVKDSDTHGGTSAGLGLGLYISHVIIERHAGLVGVNSTPGVGSTFWFTLPLAR